MRHELTSKGLCEYILEEFKRYSIKPESRTEGFSLKTEIATVDVTPFLGNDMVGFRLDVRPPADEKFSQFLAEVSDDRIFRNGGHLYTEERAARLEGWRKILERVPEKHGLVCRIKTKIDDDDLRKTIFEYLMRPILYLVYFQLRSEEPKPT